MTAPAQPAPAGIEVTAPPVVPFRYGLLSVASFETPPARPNPSAWEAHGVVYAGDSCGPQGGIWPSPCVPVEPVEQTITAYVVTFTKAAGADQLRGVLTSKHPGYGAAPVFANVDGVVLGFVNAGDEQLWPVVAESDVDVFTSNTANGDYLVCSTAPQVITIPATAQALDPPATATCQVDVTIAPDAPVKLIQDGLEFSQGTPFTIYESARCLAMGFPSADAIAKARRRLALHEQHWVETWASANAFTGATQLNGGVALPLVRAWALLEDTIADVYGGLGVIHVPRWAYGSLPERRLIERDTARYKTPLDNLVAIGAGYSGNSPAGAAPPADQVWLYATGPVKAFRSEVFDRESFDTQRNTRTAVAERVYALTFDCLRVGVLAQL